MDYTGVNDTVAAFYMTIALRSLVSIGAEAGNFAYALWEAREKMGLPGTASGDWTWAECHWTNSDKGNAESIAREVEFRREQLSCYAYNNYLRRQETGEAGSAESDWQKAIESLCRVHRW